MMRVHLVQRNIERCEPVEVVRRDAVPHDEHYSTHVAGIAQARDERRDLAISVADGGSEDGAARRFLHAVRLPTSTSCVPGSRMVRRVITLGACSRSPGGRTD